jgi:hypothetical protein
VLADPKSTVMEADVGAGLVTAACLGGRSAAVAAVGRTNGHVEVYALGVTSPLVVRGRAAGSLTAAPSVPR